MEKVINILSSSSTASLWLLIWMWTFFTLNDMRISCTDSWNVSIPWCFIANCCCHCWRRWKGKKGKEKWIYLSLTLSLSQWEINNLVARLKTKNFSFIIHSKVRRTFLCSHECLWGCWHDDQKRLKSAW